MFQMHLEGHSRTAIANKFGTTKHTISSRLWKVRLDIQKVAKAA
jgi:transposase